MASILLAEDMKGVRSSLQFILQASGFDVETAKDGTEAIDTIQEKAFDLLITDILMPGADGCEVIIKSKSLHPNMPILAISAGSNEVSVDEAFELAGQYADKTLEKPFSKNDLISEINNLLSA